jgi:polysaccharide deacetylase family protein (PEP-CTERM system associated)
MGLLNAFTVDVEDYYQVTAFEKDVDRTQWGHYDSRVVANTQRILRLLERHNIRATFFVLGWIGRHQPSLVREIHRAGHEIGSHSFWHRLVYQQSPGEFRQDLRESRDVLQDAIGEPVRAHRAPSFSITRQSLWALEILVEEGFLMDSSVFPIRHDRYGIPGANPGIHPVSTPSGTLWEFPMSVVPFAGFTMPVGGGGYFRLYPLRWTLHLLSRINQACNRAFAFYVHPWELDPQQPRLRAGSRLSRVRHYVNLASTEKKLDVLLQRFRFGRLCDCIREFSSSAPISAAPHEVPQ